MRLYLIKRKADRKFFRAINGYCMLNRGLDVEGQEWSDTPGVFFRTPDGVAANLRRLCSEPYWHTEAPPKVCPAVAKGWRELAWQNFDESKLDAYEVVAMDVDVLSMSTVPASEFVQIEAIRSVPLNKFERRAG